MEQYETILSICIPTYKRANILDGALSSISKALQLIDKEKIELVVSDNCSPDNTFQVVQEYIDKGLPIKYIRNTENIGADDNILQCFRLAKSKYVWVMGDDDYIGEKTLQVVLESIQKKDYGLIFLQKETKEAKVIEYQNIEEFIKEVSYLLTFISSKIVATKFVSEIDFDKYKNSCLYQVPLYMTAAKNSHNNLIIYDSSLFEVGKDEESSGGFNIFEVFLNKYLTIRKELFADTNDAEKNYAIEKRVFFNKFLLLIIYRFYIRRDIGNFKIDGGWSIIKKHYGKEPYFYTGLLFSLPIMVLKRVFKRLISK